MIVLPEGGAAAQAVRNHGWSPLPPAGDLQAAYLHAGNLYVSTVPCRVTTVLGSCVAVGIWDPVSGVGGLNHFLLPHGSSHAARDLSARFGDSAVGLLIDRVVEAGARRSGLLAKLFGGACVLAAFQRQGGLQLGTENVRVARQALSAAGIAVAAEAVEGNRGRKVIFQTHDGVAWVRSL